MAKKAKDWQGVVKGLLRAQLALRNLSYADLEERLKGVGVNASEAAIKNKIGRGTFSAVFFLQCLDAIGCKTLHLGDE